MVVCKASLNYLIGQINETPVVKSGQKLSSAHALWMQQRVDLTVC